MQEPMRIQKAKARQSYTNHWQLPLMKTCCARPGYFCFALWCGQCAAYAQRKQALYNDMSRYICCNGLCPCSGRMGEKSCPGCCLCMEAFFCFSQAVATTRWMIQDELQVETTKCDNCIIMTMIVLQWLSCIFHILACFFSELREVAQIIDCIADVVWCSVCACMQTQQKAELDHRDAGGRTAPMAAPAVQMIPVGAPPPAPYGAPPPGYGAPPPGYGAPPPGAYQAPPPGYGAPPPGAYQAPPPGGPGPSGYAPQKQGMYR